MSVYKFQVTFPMDTAIPADSVTNTWHFNGFPAGGATDFDNARDMLKDFYHTVPTGGGSALDTFFTDRLSTPAIVKAYALEDPIPRAPAYESTFPVGASATGGTPHEVALVLSFQSARASGINQARRRNRVYLGPFGTPSLNSDGRPSGTLLTQVQRCASTLRAAATASVVWDWVTWSETEGADHVVVGGWVDNAWDTQRRRGVNATARTTFT
jgi:hypothetical protein